MNVSCDKVVCSTHTMFSKAVTCPAGEGNQQLHTIWKKGLKYFTFCVMK